jgi:hypothetical protein
MDAVYVIYEPILDSQAGRRGFDPRLPLHKINNLGKSENQPLLRLLRFSSNTLPGRRFSLLNHLGFETIHRFDLLFQIAKRIHFQAHS